MPAPSQLIKLSSQVVKEGITIIMATHDPMVEEYAHVVYELSDGQVKDIRYPSS